MRAHELLQCTIDRAKKKGDAGRRWHRPWISQADRVPALGGGDAGNKPVSALAGNLGRRSDFLPPKRELNVSERASLQAFAGLAGGIQDNIVHAGQNARDITQRLAIARYHLGPRDGSRHGHFRFPSFSRRFRFVRGFLYSPNYCVATHLIAHGSHAFFA